MYRGSGNMVASYVTAQHCAVCRCADHSLIRQFEVCPAPGSQFGCGFRPFCCYDLILRTQLSLASIYGRGVKHLSVHSVHSVHKLYIFCVFC